MYSHATDQCMINEKVILGSWKSVNKSSFFEEISFELQEGKMIFNSWLHNRPDWLNGEWRLKSCKIYITHPDRIYSFVYTIINYTDGVLTLWDEKEQNNITFKKLHAD